MDRLLSLRRYIGLQRRTTITRLARFVCFAALILFTQAACAITIGASNTTISGTVYGDSIALQEQGISKMVPLSGATVRCGNTTAKTDTSGHYHLSLAQAKSYDCTASLTFYQPEQDTLDLVQGTNLTLNFGPASQTECKVAPRSTTEEDCESLSLIQGTLTGAVTDAGSKKPVANATVQCVPVDPHALTDEPVDSNAGQTTTTSARGTFTLGGLATGPYTCVAIVNNIIKTQQSVTIAPGATTNTTFSVCPGDCHPVHYHGGAVMRTVTAYLIFWQPWAYSFEPGGSDAHFESLMKRFIQDLQGTSYYGLLTQYWDYQGSVQNQISLGGVYVDHTPYQHCQYDGTQCNSAAATQNDPLLDQDIVGEIARALKANPTWSIGQTHEFFVFTGHDAEECQSSKSTDGCTFSGSKGYCAYHNYYYPENSTADTPTPTIYAYIPDTASEWSECSPQGSVGPNGDSIADMTINFLSHELFESVSDPLYNTADRSTGGWYNDAVDAKTQGEGEIGDLCGTQFGYIGADGGNVTLRHGDRYLVQMEWSNRTNSCSFG